MKRQWFQAEDGTYYRNCELIMDERKRALRSGRFVLMDKLADEWARVFRVGVTRKDKLERGDVCVPTGPDPIPLLLAGLYK